MTHPDLQKQIDDVAEKYGIRNEAATLNQIRLENAFKAGANLVMERVRKLEEALKLILPIVDEAYWDQWSAGNMPGSGFSNKAQHAAGQVFGWRDSKKFETWAKEIRAALEGKES